MPQQKRPEDDIRKGAEEVMTRGSWAGRLASLLGRSAPSPAPAQPASQFQNLPESQYPRSYSPMMREHLMSLPGAGHAGLAPDIQGGERYEKESFDWRNRNGTRR